MSIIQRHIYSVCLFIGMFFLVCSLILEHCRTCFLMLNKLQNKIRYLWHLILLLARGKELNRSLFLDSFLTLPSAFFLISSPAMATAQMQCAGCSYMLALLLYARTLPDRTTFYGTINIMRQNWFNMWCGHFQLLCKRFYKFCLSSFLSNLHRIGMKRSPHIRLNDYRYQPVFA